MSIVEVRIIQIEDVKIDLRAREWCKLPYPTHPNGCPNYNKKVSCPPQCPVWTTYIKPPYLLVGIKFNLAEWARKLKEKHPDFSDKQAKCCLYWQGMLRKRLREICNKFKKLFHDPIVDYCPEAGGVHVFETCYKVGIKLQKNPQDFVWKIAIIGEKND